MLRKMIFTLLTLAPLSAVAHPGEHHMGLLAGLVHLLSEPDHLAMAAIAIVIGIWGARRFIARKTAKNR